jgi:surface antigen
MASVALLIEACGMPAQFGFSDRGNRVDSINWAENAVAFSSADLVVAGAATTALLDHDDGASVPWENPLTGSRGTITPLAAPYRDNGVECRDFLASYVRERAEAWMQGEACRNRAGRWEVRSQKPWRR